MTHRTATLTLAAALLLGLALAPLVAPTASACAWNRGITDDVEQTGLVAFHDGGVCSATLLPCPDNPQRSCLP